MAGYCVNAFGRKGGICPVSGRGAITCAKYKGTCLETN